MALSFNNQKGGAQKSSVNSYKYQNGTNNVRLVGDILPRYVYWVKGTNNKSIPMECLAFDRDTESFDNSAEDPVQEMFPDLKCAWAYVTQCIDPEDGQIKVINLKRKLWDQINSAAEDLGDPTDPEKGWNIIFRRDKTGPHNFNVEYTLQPLKCKPAPLTEEEKEEVKNLKSMDEIMPRPSADTVRKQLEKLMKPSEPAVDEKDDETMEDEFKVG